MRIPRSPVSKSSTQELARAASGAITPAEAARTQIAKYGAIAVTAKSVSDLAKGMEKIKSDEEYSSVISQHHASMNSIDLALETKPFERDKNGKLVSDAESIVKQEQDARTKITGDIRKNIRAPLAKKTYDKFLVEEGIRRNQAYQAKALDRDRKVIIARLDDDVTELLNAGDYVGAVERIDAGIANGALNPLQYTEAIRMVKTREVTDSVYNLLTADENDVDIDDVTNMLDRLDDPEFDLLEGRQVLTFKNQLHALADNIEEGAGSDQREIYLDLLPMAWRGEMDLQTLIDSGLTDRGYFNQLLGMTARGGAEEVTNDAILFGYQDAISNLKRGAIAGDWKANIDTLRAEVLNPANGLSYEDRNKLEKDLDDMATGIFSLPLYQNLSRQSYESIVGFTEDMVSKMTADLQSQYKITGYVAREFQQALIRKAESLPVSRAHELDAWVEQAKDGFRLQANQANLKEIGVAVTFPKDGILTEELRVEISRQIQVWYDKNIKTGDVQAIGKKITKTINEIERLNNWTLDSPVAD